MAIDLPSVKPIQDQGDASVGRIQAQVPDARQDMAQGEAGVTGIAQQAIKYRNDIADQTADTTATDRENKLAQRFKLLMDGDPESGAVGVKYQTGDPIELHKNLDSQMQDYLKELSTAPDGQSWSTETQNLVNRRLGRKSQELGVQQLTEYGAQKHKYDDGITETGVKTAQIALPESTTHIDPQAISQGDTSSLDLVRKNFADINQYRIAQGVRYGADVEDPNGEAHYTAPDGTIKAVRLSPTTALKIKEDMSKAVYDATDNLIKTGQQDPAIMAKAEVMKNLYGHYVDPMKQGSLGEEYNKGVTALKANTLSRQIQDLPPGQIKAAIAAEPNVFVAREAEKLVAEHDLYMGRMKKQQEDVNYQKGYQQADALLKSNPILTWSQAKNDPVIQATLDKANPTQRHALETMFNPPKVSDEGAKSRMMDFLAGNDEKYPGSAITQAPQAYINQIKSGLSTPDRNKVDNKLMSWVGTNSNLMAQHQDFMHLVEKAAIAQGLIPVDPIAGKVVEGTPEFKQLNDIKYQFTEDMKNSGFIPDPARRQEEVGKFIATMVKKSPTYGQEYKGPAKFQGTGAAFGTPPQGPQPMTDKQIRTKAIGLWQQDPNNKGIPSQSILDKFIQDHPEVRK